MRGKSYILIFFDILFLLFSLTLSVYIRQGEIGLNDIENYGYPFLVFTIVWALFSVLFRKYEVRKYVFIEEALYKVVKSNLLTLMILTLALFSANLDYSRLIVIASVVFTTILELGVTYLFLLNRNIGRHSRSVEEYIKESKVGEHTVPDKGEVIDPDLKHRLINEVGLEVFNFLDKYIGRNYSRTLFISTTTRFNIENQLDNRYDNIVNFKRINDIRFINKFFESINRKISTGGIVVGFVETDQLRKKRILKKFPQGINWLYYSLDFIVKRVAPKLYLTKKLYFLLTGGNNRVISRAETLGRLCSCGFTIIEEKFIDGLLYFVGQKVKAPAYPENPTYGPFVRLYRYGKGGKLIGVYKLRTMYAFSEYIQDYVYQKNNLAEGGKFKNDFRITTLGQFLRKVWLDELPMFLNVFKGEMKIVGVRPISKQYYSLFSKELQQKRIKFKPGLIPPYYADLPKTMEEIQSSEMRYLEAYEQSPVLTDFKYFGKSMYNIFIKRARSN